MARLEAVAFNPTTWSEPATATNGAATATKAGVTGFSHYVTHITISASAAPLAAVQAQLKDGTTAIDKFEIPASAFSPIPVNYVRAFKITAGADTVLTLPALGAGVVGTVTLKGFSLKE